MMKPWSAALALLLFGAVCATGASANTITAASCSESDVQAVINGRMHTLAMGDTIRIPAGSCIWTSRLTITLPHGNGTVYIIGTGSPNYGIGTTGAGAVTTNIIDNSRTGLLTINLSAGQTIEVLLLRVSPPTSSTPLGTPIKLNGTCNSTACPCFRFSNLWFTGWAGSYARGNRLADSSVVFANDVFGVFDHDSSIFIPNSNAGVLVNIGYGTYLNARGVNGDYPWSQPLTLGGPQAVYVENSYFSNTLTNDSDIPDGGGARIVARYNTYENMNAAAAVYFHGTDTTGRMRGGLQAEVYGNTFTCAGGSSHPCTPALVEFRSGTGIVYDNVAGVVPGSYINGLVELDDYRAFAGFAPWGFCDGQGPYDDNDGVVYASGTITAVSTTGGHLTVTDSTKSWTSGRWFQRGDPYSIVDTTVNVTIGSWTGHPGFEISSSGTDSVTAQNYSQDYWSHGPPTISVGDSYEILRASVCADQPTRAESTLLSGYTTPSPTGWLNEVLSPLYEWNDAASGLVHPRQYLNVGSARIIANRDYYAGASGIQTSPTSPFDGTSGTGWGTLANRPTTCTAQVGYWATDTNVLYQCSAAKKWTSYYTPYVYPHPLDTSVNLAAPSPASSRPRAAR